ncbi:CRAL/TRIO domain-containing protein [Phthorimaea operculella]|nr:CRAL/TRIO domain-containing protein [Phthorimaea operculella]
MPAHALVLDVEGAGLQNFEIELIRYLITLFYNYPKFLDQIIIYQMAWFLSATFKVMKIVKYYTFTSSMTAVKLKTHLSRQLCKLDQQFL